MVAGCSGLFEEDHTEQDTSLMHILIGVLVGLYVVSALLLSLYALGALVLLVLWRWGRARPMPPSVIPADWPRVLVQLPVYNERAVIARLVDAVAALDYPRDRLFVQVLDDSTDETSELIARLVAHYSALGYAMVHLRRTERRGYKAGALEEGLKQQSADLVAVFDADFVPPPDFLRRVVPFFCADKQLGMVQTRWGHLNALENALTRAQALSLDGHFAIEQAARSRGGLLLNFSGSAGVWRLACIKAAGGWSAATLAEDLDLSYRAQLNGWRFLYLPDVVVPAEIPPQIAAYTQQQSRWAKGTTQNLLLHGPALWRSHLNLLQKFMGTLHLAQYLTHPLMLFLLLLTVPLLLAGKLGSLPLASLGLLGFAPPMLYLAGQMALYDDWPRRILIFPVLMGLGTGLALRNTLAVLAALRGEPNEFRRTPKFRNLSWRQSSYALQQGWLLPGEVFLTLYAILAMSLAHQYVPSLAPFMAVYVFAFGLVSGWSLLEGLQLHWRARTEQVSVRKRVSA